MKAVIQRVSSASVTVDGKVVGEIGKGYMILLGVVEGDTVKEAEVLAAKTAKLRVFEDENEKMNLSVTDTIVLFLLRSERIAGKDVFSR